MVTIKRQAKDKTGTENRNYQLLSVKP
jgi:hypothetical protein